MCDILRCTILSVQDTTILYPSCPKCFSRVTLTFGSNEQSPRWSCVRCGRDVCSAQHRYRLALRVSRDCDVLGVTVFGSSLDYFFGVPAEQLHRYLAACRESRGVPMTEWLMRRALEDCFVGRAVLLGVKLPGNVGERGYSSPGRLQGPAEWPGPVRRTPEQCTASKMTVPHEGLFGATVLQYLQSLQRVCASSDSESPLDASLGSEQASFHDYTQLCPAGLCPHASETTSSSLPLCLQWALGLSSDSVDSLERSLPGERDKSVDSLKRSLPGERDESVDSPERSVLGERDRMHRTNDSVAVATWSCYDGPHDSASRESGYSEASGDREELPGSFSSSPQTPAESPACSFSQSVFLDELLAHAFPTPFTQHNLSTESLSVGSCSRSSGIDTSQNQECSHRADSSQLAGSFDSQENSPSSTPEALVSDSEEGSYNCSAELFDDVSGLDTKDMHRLEQIRGRPRKSTCLSSKKQGRPRTPLCDLSIKLGRPRTSVCLQSIKLAPVSQSTPILYRAAPQKQRLSRLRDQHKETSHMGLDPACKPGLLEAGSGTDGQIKCTSIDDGGEIECNSIDKGWCSRAGGQIECTSIDEGGQIECTSRDGICCRSVGGQIECTSMDGCQIECNRIDGCQIEYTSMDGCQIECNRIDGCQIEYTSMDGCQIECNRIDGCRIEYTSMDGCQIECNRIDGCQIECPAAGEGSQVKCTAGDGRCCDDMLATGLPREEANWSKDLFVDSQNE